MQAPPPIYRMPEERGVEGIAGESASTTGLQAYRPSILAAAPLPILLEAQPERSSNGPSGIIERC